MPSTRKLLGSMLSAASVALMPAVPATAANVPARPADAFIESIGVNTHVRYTNTIYNDRTRLRNTLADIGIRHIRDAASVNETWIYSYYGSLYNDIGVKTLIMCTQKQGVLDVPPTSVPGLITNYAGVAAISGVEGPNEPDIFGISYPNYPTNNSDWVGGTKQYQTELYNAVKGNAATANLPVLAPAMANADADPQFNNEKRFAPMTVLDLQNMHSYPSGRMPSHMLGPWMWRSGQLAGAGNPLKPIIATETGYATSYNETGNRGVSELAQSKYVPRLFAEYFRRGVERVYLYELLDERPVNLVDYEAMLGIIRNDWTYKPAATALKNTIALLEDAGTPINAGALDYTLTAPETVRHVLLQKRDGSYWMVLWNEVSSWRNRTSTVPGADLTPAPASATLGFVQAMGQVVQYRPNASTAAQVTSTNVSSVSLSVPDELLVLKISPQPAPAVGAGTGLRGAYFPNKDVWGPAVVHAGEAVDFNWGTGSPDPAIPADNFSARWTGQVEAVEGGVYTFSTTSDDGVRLWVGDTGGASLIDNWTDHSPTTDVATVALAAGQKVDVRMEYYEAAGGATARLMWKRPGQSASAVVPRERLYAGTPAVTVRDELNDFTKVYARTDGWAFDSSNSLGADQDLSRARRTTDTRQSLTYRAPGASEFQAYVYTFFSNPGTNAALFERSADGINWSTLSLTRTTTPTNGGWYRSIFATSSLPADTNFVRLTVGSSTTGAAWNVQIGRVEYAWTGPAGSLSDIGPRHWWKLDDAAGTTALDTGPGARDGTLLNGAAWTTAGSIDGALLFDGVNDQVDLGTLDVGAAFTISAWINLSGSASNIRTIVANKVGGGASNGFALFLNAYNTTDRRLILETGNGSAGANAATAAGAVPVDGWVHVAAVVDRAAGVARLYVNGADATSGQAIRTDFGTARATRMAAFADGQFTFAGGLDDLRIYPRKLSVSEVAQLAQGN